MFALSTPRASSHENTKGVPVFPQHTAHRALGRLKLPPVVSLEFHKNSLFPWKREAFHQRIHAAEGKLQLYPDSNTLLGWSSPPAFLSDQ